MPNALNILFSIDPEKFLRENIVKVNGGNLPGGGLTAGTYDFKLEAIAGTNPQEYRLVGDPGTEDPIRAHWVPYAANSYNENDAIDDTADLVLTPTMNGCTLVVGPGANPKVAHINHKLGAGIDQAKIDNDIATNFGGGTALELKQSHYQGTPPDMTNDFTTMGIRKGGAWGFFVQRYPRPLTGSTSPVATTTAPSLIANGPAAFNPPAPQHGHHYGLRRVAHVVTKPIRSCFRR